MDSVLLVVATTIGRLRGEAPREARIVYEAMNSPSVSKPGRKMYRGLRTDDTVSIDDARVLLQQHGIGSVATTYDTGAQALRALSDALADDSKVAIVPVEGGHAVVAAVDSRSHTVRFDDSYPAEAPVGGSLPRELSFDDFVSSWGTARFGLVVAELAGEPASPPKPWTMVSPRRESTRGVIK
jgi:hypothetical protein